MSLCEHGKKFYTLRVEMKPVNADNLHLEVFKALIKDVLHLFIILN